MWNAKLSATDRNEIVYQLCNVTSNNRATRTRSKIHARN
jgi:hypothetical protein